MKNGWWVVGAVFVLFAASVWGAGYTITKDRARQAVCARECVSDCQSSSLCTWDFLNDCSRQCVDSSSLLSADRRAYIGDHVNALVKECNDCFARNQCRPVHYGDSESATCNAIRAPGRDLEEFFYNYTVHGRDDGCPAGASLAVDGSKCACEGQLDSLHTVCLDPKTVKENLKRLVSSIPDDVVQLMIERAPDKVKSIVRFVPRGDTFIAPGLDSMLSELIYESFVRDTRNLRSLLNALGPERAEQLLRLMESILKKEERALQETIKEEIPPQQPYQSPQPPSQPPVEQPPVELPPTQPPKAACNYMGAWKWMYPGGMVVGRAEVTGSNQGFQASVFNELNNIPGAVAYVSGSFDAKTFTLAGSIADPYTVRGTIDANPNCIYFQLIPTGGYGAGGETTLSILHSIGISEEYFEFRKGE